MHQLMDEGQKAQHLKETIKSIRLLFETHFKQRNAPKMYRTHDKTGKNRKHKAGQKGQRLSRGEFAPSLVKSPEDMASAQYLSLQRTGKRAVLSFLSCITFLSRTPSRDIDASLPTPIVKDTQRTTNQLNTERARDEEDDSDGRRLRQRGGRSEKQSGLLYSSIEGMLCGAYLVSVKVFGATFRFFQLPRVLLLTVLNPKIVALVQNMHNIPPPFSPAVYILYLSTRST